jgi:hypothetical protein
MSSVVSNRTGRQVGARYSFVNAERTADCRANSVHGRPSRMNTQSANRCITVTTSATTKMPKNPLDVHVIAEDHVDRPDEYELRREHHEPHTERHRHGRGTRRTVPKASDDRALTANAPQVSTSRTIAAKNT